MQRTSLVPLIVCCLAASVCADVKPIVVVERFKQMDQTVNVDWIGRAVQQTLVSELLRTKVVDVQTTAGASKYRIEGSYQVIDNAVRITATIWDVDNHSIGGLKATGTMQDLFEMQDVLADQAKRQLGAVVQPEVKPQAAQTVAAAPDPKPAKAWNPDWLHPASNSKFANEFHQYTFYNQGFVGCGYGYGYSNCSSIGYGARGCAIPFPQNYAPQFGD